MQFLHGRIEPIGIVHLQHSPIFDTQRGRRQRPNARSGGVGVKRFEETMAYVTSNRTATSSLGARFAEMGKQATEAFVAWRLYRRTLNELQDLSPRELADLGLNRAMLRQAAFDAVYGKAA
jgi:uncharacterized protein YjiS (DUF1127 family)